MLDGHVMIVSAKNNNIDPYILNTSNDMVDNVHAYIMYTQNQ